MPKLGVNVDHVATLRQARLPSPKSQPTNDVYPDPVEAAKICLRAGAHSVVMHLREDRRHVQDHDLLRLKRTVPIKLNLEMSAAASVVKVALKVAPEQATLVPERRMERTTEGGLDLVSGAARVRRAVAELKGRGIAVSLFIDPDRRQLEASKKLGADAVEFHTGDYANASGARAQAELKRLKKATALALDLGLVPHAGHGLDYRNVRPVAAIEGIGELNIGYSIVSRALWTGFDRAVRDMLALCR